MIPYAEYPEKLQSADKKEKIENGKVYEMEAFMDKMNKIFDDSLMTSEEGGTMGLPYRDNKISGVNPRLVICGIGFLLLIIGFLCFWIPRQYLFGVSVSGIESVDFYYREQRYPLELKKDFKLLKEIEKTLNSGDVSQTGLRHDVKFSDVEKHIEKEYRLDRRHKFYIRIQFKENEKVVLPGDKILTIQDCDGMMFVFEDADRVVEDFGPGVYLSENGERRFSKHCDYFNSLLSEIPDLEENWKERLDEEKN